MTQQKLVKSSSPHIRARSSKQMIMLMVIVALLPAVIAGVYFFGISAALIISVCVITAIICDICFQYLTKQKKIRYINGSAIVTGLLLALVLPPTVPLWIPFLGTIFAIGIGKYAFGIGNNVFNPALIGRAFLVTSFAQYMTTWINVDGVSSATPLGMAKDQGVVAALEQVSYTSLLIGNHGGCIGETSALALAIGGIFLICIRIIDWKIPLTYIGTVGALTFFSGGDPLFHILSGGLLIGAFFMATDYVTIPLTPKGRIIFAFGCGVLTFLFRGYSSMPEGVMYSILLMNAASPLIERFTRPKPFGHSIKDTLKVKKNNM